MISFPSLQPKELVLSSFHLLSQILSFLSFSSLQHLLSTSKQTYLLCQEYMKNKLISLKLIELDSDAISTTNPSKMVITRKKPFNFFQVYQFLFIERVDLNFWNNNKLLDFDKSEENGCIHSYFINNEYLNSNYSVLSNFSGNSNFSNKDLTYNSSNCPNFQVKPNNFVRICKKSTNSFFSFYLNEKSIKQIEFGHKFFGLLTFEGELYFSLSRELNLGKNFEQRKNVKYFSAKRNLIYLTEKGQIFIIYYEKLMNLQDCQEEVLFFSLLNPIDCFYSSYNFLFFITKEKNQYYVYNLLEFDINNINDESRLKEIKTEQDIGTIISACVGYNVIYVVTETNKTYHCDLKILTENNIYAFSNQNIKLEFQIYAPLQNRKIIALYSNLTTYFAVEKEFVQNIESWSNEEVIFWADKIGFGDCSNLLKFDQIRGQELMSLNAKFLSETLGITSQEKQRKFLNEVELKKTETFKRVNLLGWGSNNYGQLNLPNVSYKIPTYVPIPTELEEKGIERVECGWKFTAILSNDKHLWVMKSKINLEKETENYLEKRKARENSDPLEKKTKIVKKHTVSSSHKKTYPSYSWIDITHLYTGKAGLSSLIHTVSIAKDTFAVLTRVNLEKKTYFKDRSYVQLKNNVINAKTTSKRGGIAPKKMRTAQFIMQQLRWNQIYDKNEWVVGIDIGKDFVERSFLDLNNDEGFFGSEGLIRIFKKKGVVVWDRHSKMDNF